MTEDGGLHDLYALYVALVSVVASLEYLTGWNLLADGLGLAGLPLTLFYFLSFVALFQSLPKQLEDVFS